MKLYNLILNASEFGFINTKTKTDTKLFKMSRNKIYWICQIAGWLTIGLFNVLALAAFDNYSYDKLIYIFYFVILGISATHIYRYVIKKYKWFELPVKKLIPRTIFATIIIGTIVFSILYSVQFLSGAYTGEEYKWGRPIFGIFNSSIFILIWSLIYFSVYFFENYKKAEIESLIWEAAVKDFELKTLKSQLNPHFMFNAMNSIRSLIEEDPQRAKKAITQLSNILRYSLKIERKETVTLEDEIQTVTDYLELEYIRFEERLKYSINTSPDSLKIELPPMMIQTLVENALKHGIAKRTNGGFVELNSSVKNGTLVVEIKNSGQFSEQSMMNSTGFGISNTKHRLSLLYGEKSSFEIKNENNETVSVKLIIPIGGTLR
jgi:two-component system, LytTR family, sensor kinase